jgi:hypothetical protein
MEPMPCPFCGGNELAIHEIEECISCYECGARGPTFSPIIRGRRSTWQTRRAPDPLREALMWAWAAEHNAHDWNDCGEDNDATGPGDIPCRTCAEIADMRDTAAAEVGRLLKEMER